MSGDSGHYLANLHPAPIIGHTAHRGKTRRRSRNRGSVDTVLEYSAFSASPRLRGFQKIVGQITGERSLAGQGAFLVALEFRKE
jgi:hypothetical protein